MKHVKDIILEKKNFKKYEMFNDFLLNLFKSSDNIRKVTVYEEYNRENNEIYIDIQYVDRIKNEDFLHLNKYFKGLYFYFTPTSSSSIMFTVRDVPKEFFYKIDVEINLKKYNL